MCKIMTCAICGSTKTPLTTFIDWQTKDTTFICSSCAAEKSANSIHDLEHLEETIAMMEDMVEKFEELIRETPKQPKIPEALEGIAFTPLAAYKMAQGMLSMLKVTKLELLTEVGSEAWLEYELRRAVEKEDFEKSARLRDELQAIKNKAEE